mgnify:CR=1 FL=1
MRFFVQHLSTYAPKNRAWKKFNDYVVKFERVLIPDEISRDALVEELRLKTEEINAQHPKLKPIRFSSGNLDGTSFRVSASVDKCGCPDTVFSLDIVRVRSIYQYSESMKGGIE